MALRVSRPALRDAFTHVPEIMRFGLKLAPGNLAEGISYDAPIWVLGLSLPAAAVGAYSRAWQTDQPPVRVRLPDQRDAAAHARRADRRR